jgi:hypothetical protein
LSGDVIPQGTPGAAEAGATSTPYRAEETQALDTTQLLDEVSGLWFPQHAVAFGQSQKAPAHYFCVNIGHSFFPCLYVFFWLFGGGCYLLLPTSTNYRNVAGGLYA